MDITAFSARSLTENPVLISDGLPQPRCSTHVVMWGFPSTSRLRHILINTPAVFVDNSLLSLCQASVLFVKLLSFKSSREPFML